MKRYVGALVVLAVLVGCASLSVVEPKRVEIGRVYTVDPQIKWSRFYRGDIETWTVDGLSLQAIHFIKGIEEDEPLVVTAATGDREKWPRFEPEMTPNEILEFVVDSLARLGYAQLQAHNLRPERFGRLQGFRFELTFLASDGLEGQGLVVGAVIEKRLHLIMYVGTREHYYPKHIEEVERIIQSIELS